MCQSRSRTHTHTGGVSTGRHVVRTQRPLKPAGSHACLSPPLFGSRCACLLVCRRQVVYRPGDTLYARSVLLNISYASPTCARVPPLLCPRCARLFVCQCC